MQFGPLHQIAHHGRPASVAGAVAGLDVDSVPEQSAPRISSLVPVHVGRAFPRLHQWRDDVRLTGASTSDHQRSHVTLVGTLRYAASVQRTVVRGASEMPRVAG